ncbi:XRE family transcriptional regulator [Clostridium fermenticellae]|uniref:XRE family transcriptional regulator n=1 Tax=Clostridium fermenticellae TaxID=2068654 RepID=A0A386H6R1_9CLOT|nr:helix-turn-helix transcriptional regulator [Clostridium fermenticellae]AYD41304.1 XRE family transcriptional regulator [Clostridium fermenticellae]
MSRVGEKIKNVRESNSMSQKQLAKKLGVSEGFINEVESGKKIINQNLIDRISKILGKDINDITMSFEEEVFKESKNESSNYTKKSKSRDTNDVWNDAFGSVLKNVPIYGYDLKSKIGTKKMPIINNKIEGYSQDRVVYIEIADDDMIGFRMAKGDIAFGVTTHEVENNSICLVECKGERCIRQIKKLDSNKVLLISNRQSLRTETVEIRNLSVLVKFNRVEIKL